MSTLWKVELAEVVIVELRGADRVAAAACGCDGLSRQSNAADSSTFMKSVCVPRPGVDAALNRSSVEGKRLSCAASDARSEVAGGRAEVQLEGPPVDGAAAFDHVEQIVGAPDSVLSIPRPKKSSCAYWSYWPNTPMSTGAPPRLLAFTPALRRAYPRVP